MKHRKYFLGSDMRYNMAKVHDRLLQKQIVVVSGIWACVLLLGRVMWVV